MVLAKARVTDFDQFLSVFKTRGAEHRKSFGSRGSQVLRNADDPNEVWILFDWDREGFERFIDDPQTKELMADAGLEAPPEPVFVSSEAEVGS